jgi:hypothetical protein
MGRREIFHTISLLVEIEVHFTHEFVTGVYETKDRLFFPFKKEHRTAVVYDLFAHKAIFGKITYGPCDFSFIRICNRMELS